MLRLPLPATAESRGVFSREEALAAGWTERSIRTQLASVAWQRLARGVYVERLRFVNANPTERHRLTAMAAGLRRNRALVGVSAACAHRFTLLDSPSGRPQLRSPAQIPVEDRAVVDGVRVTSTARTVVDCACLLGVEPGLVVADSALHNKAVGHDQLRAAIARLAGTTGIDNARAVLAEANGRSESPLETISRYRFLRAGLPRPTLQATLGEYPLLYRVDFLWPEHGVVGEADGLIKYVPDVDPDPADRFRALRIEKRRQIQIEDLGLEVVRWLWDEMWHTPEVVVRRVLRAFDRARFRTGLPPTG